jgi:hypothetical protein
VFGTIEVEVTADPERASHVVRIQRKLPTDADWVTLNTDDSSPVYTYYDNLSTVPMGTQIQYRAVLDEPDGTQVISPIRTVTRTAPTPLVNSVTVAGSLQSEIGCATDLRPAPPVTSRSTRTTGCGKRLSSSRGRLRVQGGHQRLMGCQLRRRRRGGWCRYSDQHPVGRQQRYVRLGASHPRRDHTLKTKIRSCVQERRGFPAFIASQ